MKAVLLGASGKQEQKSSFYVTQRIPDMWWILLPLFLKRRGRKRVGEKAKEKSYNGNAMWQFHWDT